MFLACLSTLKQGGRDILPFGFVLVQPRDASEGTPLPCSHPAAPHGASRERGFHTREGCGAAQPCGCWMGPHQNSGWSWEPAIPGQQTRLVRAPKPQSLPDRRPRWLPAAGPRPRGCVLLLSAFRQPSSDPAKPSRSAFLPGNELPGLFLATAMRTIICWDGAGGPIPAQERSGPFPCEDAAPQPSEAKEIGKVSAPVRRASTGAGTCKSDGVPGLRCLWAEIILSTALPLNHSRCLGNSPDIIRQQ